MSAIGSLNEKPLHASLKEWYRDDGDLVEVPTDGFVVDLVRADGSLVEIQTASFHSMRRKLDRLLDAHHLRVVFPVAVEKWILKLDDEGRRISRRRSPKRGIAADLCAELVSFPSLLSHPNFTLEVALVIEEEVRSPDRKAWRRGGFGIDERRLIDVVDTVLFSSPDDLLTLLPQGLPDPFDTADLAAGLGRSRHLAREVAYCLRTAGAIETVGRDRRGVLYRLPPSPLGAS